MDKKIRISDIFKSTGSIISNDNLGIPVFNLEYLETNILQDKLNEFQQIINFLKKFVIHYSKENSLKLQDLKLEFINYGKTELVFVLTVSNFQQLTLLVKQPVVSFGKIKQEANILFELKKKDNNVIAPIQYFSFGNQELYVTPYIYQARCIASYDNWGMYIPEPYYRFEPFTKQQESIVNCSMIAKLVSLFNFEKQEGISSCKLGGGDFMLPKGWEKQTPTIDNTFDNLYLIAAREKINCSFEEYIKIIRDEFSRKTINENQSSLKINLRGRVPMQSKDIEEGIKLGKKLLNI